jgi:hypothetical protein
MPTSRTVGGGLALLGLSIGALLPVFLVIYPSLGLGPADAARPQVFLPIVARTPALFTGPGLLELAGHAIGAAAMIGLWLRTGTRSFLLTAATFAGVVWMAVDTVDNAIGLQLVPRLASDFAAGDASAAATYLTVSLFMDSLRLAGHFAGGLWVVGIAVFALRSGGAPSIVAWLGIPVGLVLAGNPLVPALLNVSFITLPVWLVAFGIALARRGSVELEAVPDPSASASRVPAGSRP